MHLLNVYVGHFKIIYRLSENWIKSEDTNFGQVPAAAALLSFTMNSSADTVYFFVVLFSPDFNGIVEHF